MSCISIVEVLEDEDIEEIGVMCPGEISSSYVPSPMSCETMGRLWPDIIQAGRVASDVALPSPLPT